MLDADGAAARVRGVAAFFWFFVGVFLKVCARCVCCAAVVRPCLSLPRAAGTASNTAATQQPDPQPPPHAPLYAASIIGNLLRTTSVTTLSCGLSRLNAGSCASTNSLVLGCMCVFVCGEEGGRRAGVRRRRRRRLSLARAAAALSLSRAPGKSTHKHSLNAPHAARAAAPVAVLQP